MSSDDTPKSTGETKRLTRKSDLETVADALSHPGKYKLSTVEGRTLPLGMQWCGHDIPGRGKAAARRLRQQEKKNK